MISVHVGHSPVRVYRTRRPGEVTGASDDDVSVDPGGRLSRHSAVREAVLRFSGEAGRALCAPFPGVFLGVFEWVDARQPGKARGEPACMFHDTPLYVVTSRPAAIYAFASSSRLLQRWTASRRITAPTCHYSGRLQASVATSWHLTYVLMTYCFKPDLLYLFVPLIWTFNSDFYLDCYFITYIIYFYVLRMVKDIIR